MSALAASHPTLLDLAKRLDPDGKIDVIAEILTQENPILEDMNFVEGNLPTGTVESSTYVIKIIAENTLF